MAAEVAKPAVEEVEVVVAELPPSEAEKAAVAVDTKKEAEGEAKVPEEEDKEKEKDEEKISESVSFKEETYIVGELPESQKKVLEELKKLIEEALKKHEFTKPKEEEKKEEEVEEEEKKVDEEADKKEEEEKKKEETTEAEPAAVAADVEVMGDVVVVEEVVVAAAAEATTEVAEEKVVVEEVTATVVVDEEDGTKTVEAIKETIVEVSTSVVKSDEPAPPKEEQPEEEAIQVEAEVPLPPPLEPEEVFLWGIPILGDEKSDVILLKFLRARDFKAKEAFSMIKSSVLWRKEFGIESLLEEAFEAATELEKVVFIHGLDREGHPVCYNVYGELQRKELYQSSFSDEEKRKKFLKWRIQVLEKSIIEKLDFSPDGGVSSFVQINDLRNSPALFKRDIWGATNKALQLLQDNYPEFVAKQVFINVPWWYLAYNKMISPFLTKRTKSKFVFAVPSRTPETLFKYIAPEQVPVQFGGLSREGGLEFSTADPATTVTIKPSATHTIEFPVSEKSVFVWELRVVGSEVSYGAEFVPDAEGSYTVIVQKTRKLTSSSEDAIISDNFKVNEPGKLVITIDNNASKKKKKLLLYRSKTNPLSEDL